MAWYYILFFSVCTFFIVKTVFSWVFGDTEVDFDADGDIDFDVSSMLSFKGILHFLLGFSTYLAATARFDRAYDAATTYQFTWIHYAYASVIGVVFMIVLWRLYKLMMKLNHGNQSNVNLCGCTCTVLTNLGNGSYVVLVKSPVGVFKKTFEHIDLRIDIPIGTELQIMKEVSTNKCVIS